MAFSSYKYGFGGTTTMWGIQSISGLASAAIAVRNRSASRQTTYNLHFGQIQPSQVEESGGPVDLLNDNLKTGTTTVTAPDGTTQTVRFDESGAQSSINSATVASVGVALRQV